MQSRPKESLNQTGDDIAVGFGLTGKTGGTAPAYAVVAYGSVAGGYGTLASVGVEGFDGGGSAGNDLNVGVFGQSNEGTGVVGLANANIGPAAYAREREAARKIETES